MTGFRLRSVDKLGDRLVALAELVLQMAKPCLVLTLGIIQVVVGELGEHLPKLVHDQVRMGLASITEHLERSDCFKSKSFRLSRQCSSFYCGPETGTWLL